MSSLLEQFEGRESLLLMHLAGELSPQDAASVEHMVQTDAALSAEYSALQQTDELIVECVGSFDNLPTFYEERAIRQACGAIRQWQAGRHKKSSQGLRDRWRSWAVLSAAAAIALLAVGLAIWQGEDHREVGGRVAVRLAVPATYPSPAAATASEADEVLERQFIATGDQPHELVAVAQDSVSETLASSSDEHTGAGHDEPVFDVPLDAAR